MITTSSKDTSSRKDPFPSISWSGINTIENPIVKNEPKSGRSAAFLIPSEVTAMVKY